MSKSKGCNHLYVFVYAEADADPSDENQPEVAAVAGCVDAAQFMARLALDGGELIDAALSHCGHFAHWTARKVAKYEDLRFEGKVPKDEHPEEYYRNGPPMQYWLRRNESDQTS